MSNVEKKECWCGCSSFDVCQTLNDKGDVLIICQRCKAERQVKTPGVAAKKYQIEPDFKILHNTPNAADTKQPCDHDWHGLHSGHGVFECYKCGTLCR